MTRTYLALAGLALAGGAALPLVHPPLAAAVGIFQTAEVEADRFAVLARPVGDNDWTLLVLEQLAAQPSCWEDRKDGLVDPALNRFDYSGICNRYLDSNGYSLRVAEEDMGTSYRLRVQQVGSRLELQAFSPDSATVLVLGSGQVPLRDRDAFVALRLEPGWELKRRTYGERALSHIYFASPTSLEQLIATAGGGEPARPQAGERAGSPVAALSEAAEVESNAEADAASLADETFTGSIPSRAIALRVIPFSDVSGEGR